MDPFAIIMFGGVGGLLIALYLLGRFYPGDGSQQIDWRPTRSPEVEVQNEIDDLDQLMEGVNRRRRARGKPEHTEDSLVAGLAADTKASFRRRDDYLADLEVVQMLERKNARRRARGLPEITEAEFRAGVEGRA